jgi:hypothetical protein
LIVALQRKRATAEDDVHNVLRRECGGASQVDGAKGLDNHRLGPNLENDWLSRRNSVGHGYAALDEVMM